MTGVLHKKCQAKHRLRLPAALLGGVFFALAIALGAAGAKAEKANVDGTSPAELSRLSIEELADIERIEVVSGPGGTLWGSNAVSGVINIITRNSWDTAGGFVDLGAGDVNRKDFWSRWR